MPDNKRSLTADFDEFLKVDSLITTAAQKHGVAPDLIWGQAMQESRLNPRAQSPVGAQGVMQLMPATAKELGVTNSFDPQQNIDGGAKYMAQLLKRYNGDQTKALMAYNAGMGNVDKGRAQGFPETQDYVKRVTANRSKYGQPGVGAKLDLNAPSAPSLGAEFDAFLKSEQKAPVDPSQEDHGWMRNMVNKIKANPVDFAVDSLPVVGGALGAVAGGVGGGLATYGIGAAPSAAIGAGAGSAGGEAFKQLINRFRGKDAPQTAGDAAAAIGKEGAIGAATELGGRALIGAGKWTGQQLVKHALKAKGAPEEVKQIVQTTIDDGLGISERGAKKAEKGTTAARNKHDKIVTDAEAAGAPKVQRANVLQHLYNGNGKQDSVLDWIAKQNEPQPYWRRLNEFEQNFTAAHPSEYLPTRALELKRSGMKNAQDLYKKHGEGSFDEMLEAGIAGGQQADLERVVGTSLSDANAETQKKLLAQKAINKRLESTAGRGLLDRHGAAGALTAAALIPGAAPVALPLALLTEIAKNPRIEALLGRAIFKGAKPAAVGVTSAERTRQTHDKTTAKRKVTKAELDARYERYLKGGQ